MEGEFPKHQHHVVGPDHLIAFTEPEQRYRARDGLAADRRLGCHARITGDLVVDVPPESQLHRQVVRKEADAHPIEVDPVVRLYYVEVREPDLADPSGDLQRLREALGDAVGRSRTSAFDPVDPAPVSSARSATAAWAVTVSGPRRRHDHRGPSRVPRRRARRGVRRRVDDRGRAPVRPAHRRRAGVGRRDEPADQVRRGPDEPGVLRDAASRCGGRPDRRRCAGCIDDLIGDLCAAGGRLARATSWSSRSSGTRSCTTWCSGSTPPSSAAHRSR